MLVIEFNEGLSLPTKYNKVRDGARKSVREGSKMDPGKEESEHSTGAWRDNGRGHDGSCLIGHMEGRAKDFSKIHHKAIKKYKVVNRKAGQNKMFLPTPRHTSAHQA